MIILSVEGNIGSGKSTVLQEVKARLPPNAKILMEPVNSFQEYNGTNPLKLFYEYPSKYAFFTQRHIIDSLYKHFREQVQEKEHISLLLCERNLFSSIVFTNVLFRMGWLTDNEKEKLHGYSQQMLAKVCPDIPMGAHYVFYIHELPQVCQNRIFKRGREGESVISCEYLSYLEEEYNDYREKFTKTYGDFSLWMVPPDRSRQEKVEDLLTFVNQILKKER